jgi:hypothetical protein
VKLFLTLSEYYIKDKTKEDTEMRTIKIIYLVPLLLFFFAAAGNAGPTRLTAATENELRDQLGEEIEDALQSRFLRYDAEHLDGIVLIEATVNENGKIVFRGFNAADEDLRTNVYFKLNSLNLWTYPDFANTLYRYKVSYSD